MSKFLLLFATSLAVIQWETTANTIRKPIEDGKICFFDTVDESEAIREKIRTDMDNYKRIKELTFKKKLMDATTIEVTTEMETQTSSADETTTIASRVVLSDAIPTTSESSVVSSSTIRQIVIDFGDDEEETEEPPAEVESETSTAVVITVDDRNIINAPLICKAGQALVRGKCRKEFN